MCTCGTENGERLQEGIVGAGTKDVILVGGTVGRGKGMTKVGKKAQKKGECDGEDG